MKIKIIDKSHLTKTDRAVIIKLFTNNLFNKTYKVKRKMYKLSECEDDSCTHIVVVTEKNRGIGFGGRLREQSFTSKIKIY